MTSATESTSLSRAGDPYPPYPYSWYAVAFAHELRPGTVLTRRFLDGEIVLFRTASGELSAVEPFCPSWWPIQVDRSTPNPIAIAVDEREVDRYHRGDIGGDHGTNLDPQLADGNEGRITDTCETSPPIS